MEILKTKFDLSGKSKIYTVVELNDKRSTSYIKELIKKLTDEDSKFFKNDYFGISSQYGYKDLLITDIYFNPLIEKEYDKIIFIQYPLSGIKYCSGGDNEEQLKLYVDKFIELDKKQWIENFMMNIDLTTHLNNILHPEINELTFKDNDTLEQILYLSNLDHCQNAKDMQYHLQKIHELIRTNHPQLKEKE